MPSKVKKVLGVPVPVAIPKPQKKTTSNVFGDDSDPDEDPSNIDWVQKSLLKQSTQGSIQQRQATQVIKKALKEDPSVYQYDELYDEMEQKRENAKELSTKDRKPKYIEKLIKATEMRQKEYEAKLERDVQKEREAEGDKFKDKEAFVTGAYRKKMEDMEREKEELARKDAIDEMTDVTKQKDLSGFYRHLYKQTLGPEPVVEERKSTLSPEQDSADQKQFPSPESDSKKSIQPQTPDHGSKESRNRSPDSKLRNYRDRSPKDSKEHRNRSPDSRQQRLRTRSPDSRRHKNMSPDSRDFRNRRNYSPDSRHRRNYSPESRHRRNRSPDSRYRTNRSPDSRHHRNRSPDSRHNRKRRPDSKHHRNRSTDSRHDRKRSRSPQNRDERIDDQKGRDGNRDKSSAKHEEKRKRASAEKIENTTKRIKEEPTTTTVEDEISSIIDGDDGLSTIKVKVKTSIWDKRTIGQVLEDAILRYFDRKQSNSLQAAIVQARF